MECKFCHEMIENDSAVCPFCGKDLTEETLPEEETLPMEETLAEEAPAGEEAPAEEALPAQEQKTSPMLLWGIIIGMIVALLGVAFFFLLQGRPKTVKGEISLSGMQSYTVAPKDMTEKRGDQVVASVGVENKLGWLTDKDELTNAELALYYWDTFYTFYENYYYYLAYMGLDPLTMDTSPCTMAEGQSWQEYFLTQALTRYRDQTAIYKTALAEGFTLTEEEQKVYDENIKTIRETADIADAIYVTYGPGITVEDYLEYWKVQYTYSVYVSRMMDTVQCTDDDLSAYYDAHATDYASINVQKLDKPVVNIRHILIEPADKTKDEDWTAAEKTVQDVYNTWLGGEKTEESFAELAKLHSADGNKDQGGIYENVFPGQMVAEFQDWCFDDSRKPGDSGIVKTEFGYHIMYFIEQGDYIYWKEAVRVDYVSEETNNLIAQKAAKYTLAYTADRFALSLPGQLLTTES